MTLLSLLRSATASKAGNTSSAAEVEEFFDQQAKSHVHLASPGVTDDASANEVLCRQFKPVLPSVFTASPGEPNLVLTPCDEAALINKQDRENNAPPSVSEETKKILSSLFPNTIESPFQLLQTAPAGAAPLKKPLRIGAVLSGGQAAGGHNVLCGIFDYVKRVNPESRVYGFLGGPHGVYSHEYKELTAEVIDHYRNSGGFDMIRSGRHKVETEEQKAKSLEICNTLQLDGLVVIGGDDSNTNAAVLAEYFKSKGSMTSVVGCPKTIDGDLKNYFVEISFGFDTACKTYNQIIGALMEDARTGGHVYHFVRLMGRSASLITLECALQSHPNLALIGEEVQARKYSLQQLVATLADLVEARHAKGRDYGIVLLPEGLIEFIPEVGILIGEINHTVAQGPFSVDKLSAESRRVFEGLPESTQQQLLLDRDPHGNVQVAMIHTEKLLAEMTETELRKRRFHGDFHASCHYLGYEGRSGYPSLFDATYCYALGHVAAALVQHGATACMAVLKNMSSSSSPAEWKPAGIPLTRMMTLETRKGKANVPVIKKFLVDIDRPLFKIFAQVRDEWKTNDFYQIPGPLQLPQLGSGSASHHSHHHGSSKGTAQLQLPYTLAGAPPAAALLSTDSGAESLSRMRRAEEPLVPAALKHKDTVLCFPSTSTAAAAASGGEGGAGGGVCVGEKQLAAAAEKLKGIFPLLIEECCSGSSKAGFMKGSSTMVLQPKAEPQHHLSLRVGGGGGEKIRVGVVLIGRQMPAASNVLLGVVERVSMLNGKVFGFRGARGLLKNEHIIVSEKDAQMHRNLPAFDLLGRTEKDEALLCTSEGMRAAVETIRQVNLDLLVVIGWTYLHAATLSELLAQEKLHARVVSVAAEADFSHFLPNGCLHILRHLTGNHVVIGGQQPVVCCQRLTSELMEQDGCRRLGFDTQTKVAAEMIGNLETDSNSAAKYYYFCAAGGGWDAECEAAIQTHPNVVIASQKWKDLPLQDLVNYLVEVVKERATLKKNFGVIVLNLNFFLLHKELRCLAMEVDAHLLKLHREVQHQGKEMTKEAEAEQLTQHLSPAAQQTFGLLPTTFRRKLISCISKHPFPRGLHKFPVHELLSHMVGEALKKEKAEGRYSGSFSPVCFEFSSALSSSFPSYHDCSLGLMLGQLAVLAGTAQALPSHAVHVSIKNPDAAPTHWEPQVRPTAVLAAQAHCLQISSKPAPETGAAKEEQGAAAATASELFCMADGCASGGGKLDSVMVRLVEQGMQQQQQKGGGWTTEEKYCNPGPLQFGSHANNFCFSRALWEVTHMHQ